MVPAMGTYSEQKDISAALFGKTRRAVLSLLFTNPERSFYMREIIRELDLGRGAVQRELENLTGAGLLTRSVEGNQVHFMVRQDSPVFNELKSMMVKTTGLADVVRHSLDNLSDHIKIALLYGSVAGGTFTADSDIDLLVVGEAGFSEVAQALSEAQDKLGREINPSVYRETELHEKLRSGNHFVCSIMDGPKIFLIGGEDELARLAGQRLVGRAPAKLSRDRRLARPGR